jgi:alkylation response protein AidB-like acyl-CoA dehydrogenase
VILDHVNDEAAFRASVREWLTQVVPQQPKPAESGDSKARYEPIARWWMSELNKQGLGTPHWPKQYGGVALSIRLQAILAQEFARADAPTASIFNIARNHVPATLLAWGTEEQKRKYLPEISNGTVWCQGFSEPGAGSDLASLQTRAVRQGDHYVINGQKTWSTYSMYADRALLLARTDPSIPKHGGISFFLMDMKDPGIEIRPIHQVNGEADFGELFLTDVRIPIEDRVGEEGQGWTVAQSTLSAERGLLSFQAAERLRYVMERFQRESVAQKRRWISEPELTQSFVKLFARLQAIRNLMRDMLFSDHATDGSGPIMSASVKILYSTLRKDWGNFLCETEGPDAILEENIGDDLSGGGEYVYLSAFSLIIGGGTNEIMRNIIAERGLGLPKG